MKRFLDMNNKFHKVDETYVYKPKFIMVMLTLLMLGFLAFMLIHSNVLVFEREKFSVFLACLLGSFFVFYLCFGLIMAELLSIDMSKNGCTLKWMYFKMDVLEKRNSMVRF